MKSYVLLFLLFAQQLFAQTDSTDDFKGKYRRVPKTTMAEAKTDTFATLGDLWVTLPEDSTVSRKFPPNRRLPVENRNVCVEKAWILAANRAQDNDLHLMLGDGPNADTALVLVAEISGLPDKSAPSYSVLAQVRAAFFEKMGPFPNYKSKFFRKNAVPVRVCGSLFFDGKHGEHKLAYLFSDTAWEIHPLTWIQFLE